MIVNKKRSAIFKTISTPREQTSIVRGASSNDFCIRMEIQNTPPPPPPPPQLPTPTPTPTPTNTHTNTHTPTPTNTHTHTPTHPDTHTHLTPTPTHTSPTPPHPPSPTPTPHTHTPHPHPLCYVFHGYPVQELLLWFDYLYPIFFFSCHWYFLYFFLFFLVFLLNWFLSLKFANYVIYAWFGVQDPDTIDYLLHV